MLVNNVKETLLVKFNKDNAIFPYLTMEDVTWTNIEIWLQGQCNSRVTITAIGNSVNFSGSKVLNFNRRDIAVDLKGLKIPGKRKDYTTLYQIITALHDKCGVPLVTSEFINLGLPASGPITIQPTTTCMAYMPTTSIALEFAET